VGTVSLKSPVKEGLVEAGEGRREDKRLRRVMRAVTETMYVEDR
jgi:hypothetical protein